MDSHVYLYLYAIMDIHNSIMRILNAITENPQFKYGYIFHDSCG